MGGMGGNKNFGGGESTGRILSGGGGGGGGKLANFRLGGD